MQHPPPHPLPPITPRLNPVVCQNFYETGFLGATQWDHRNEKRLAEIRADEHFCLFGMVDCKGTPPTKKIVFFRALLKRKLFFLGGVPLVCSFICFLLDCLYNFEEFQS